MNIPPSLGHKLNDLSHSFRHVSAIGMSQATDQEIIEMARKNTEVIMTNDLDYGRLLAFEKSNCPSVVIFRVSHNDSAYLFKLFQAVFERAQNALEQGAIVVLEDHGLRIRRLPIQS